MSRIIRLASDPVTVSRFQKAMPAPVLCEPNSTIALKSLSFELAKDTTFDIPDSSYFFYYSIGDKNEQNRDIQYLIQLTPGTYTQSSLIQSLQFQMNQTLAGVDPTDNQYGFEWRLSLDTNGKLNMAFDRADLGNVQSANINLTGIAVSGNTYTKSAVDTGEFNAFAQVKPLVSKGGFKTQVTLGGISPETTEFIVGLCPDNIQGGVTDSEAFSFAVLNQGGTNGKYSVRTQSGALIITEVDIQTGATVEILKEFDTEENRGWISAYQDDTLIYREYVTETFLNANHYYTWAIGDGGADISFINPAITQSPFVTSSPGGAYTLNSIAPSIYISDLNTRSPSVVTIVFSSPSMQQFLGFSGTTLKLNAVSGNFVGDSTVAASVVNIGEDLVVELLNMPIEGYDTLTGLAAPILAVIPVESLARDVSGLGFSYIEPFVTRVKLHNKTQINVNTFYVNIRSGSNYLSLTDRVYMQLLLD